MKHFRQIFFLLLITLCGKAQFYNLPEEYNFSLLTERQLALPDSSVHSGIKPYIPFFSKKYIHVADSHIIFKYITDDPALDIVFYKPLIDIEPKKENYKIKVAPILGYDKGRDFADTIKQNLGTNTRGFIASVQIGSDFYCETMFSENQSFFPAYISDFAKATGVVPGQGRHKTFKITGYDYAFSTGFVSYQPHKNINLQAGHGKHKVGHGYRSLLWSDNSFNYPFARITQQWFKGRLQYTNLYMVLMNLQPATAIPVPNAERLFQKKPAAFQQLSFNVNKHLNIGLFQALIAQTHNSKNKPRIDAMYASPVIFSQAAYYGFNNVNNVLAGIDVLCKINKSIQFYGQLALDNPTNNSSSSATSYGYQAGAKYFDAFGIKNLFLQLEYNKAEFYLYGNPPRVSGNQMYYHYNQRIANMPVTNEWLVIADYKYKRFLANVRWHEQQFNVFNTQLYYKNSFVNANIGYLINPSYNLHINLGYIYRYQNFNTFNGTSFSTNYLYVGFRTNLYNTYFDF